MHLITDMNTLKVSHVSAQGRHSMRIAANIADLTRYDEIPRQCLLAPVIVNREIVQVEPGRLDGAAVIFECPTDQARSIVSLLRSYDDKAKRYRLRAYQEGPRKGWAKIP